MSGEERMRILVATGRAAIIAVALVGCTALPTMDEAENSSGKRFEPVPDRGVLYIYRESPFGLAVVLPTSLDSRLLGSLGSDTYFRMEVEPGRHEVTCQGENTGAAAIDVAANQVAFVEVAIQFGFIRPRCRVFVPSDQVGRKSVMGARRLRPAFGATAAATP
jgi:hypothetical protein